MLESSFLETADRIGARLCRDAVWSQKQCNWMGWALEVVGKSWSPVYRAQTATLYDGTAGIALFLARLYSFTDDPVQRATAIGAANQALAGAASIPQELRASFYSGTVGIAYALLELGTALEDEKMIARGVKEIEKAARNPAAAMWVDILGGAAGTIQALVDIARRFEAPHLTELALEYGTRLLRAASKSEVGWSWDTLPGQTEKHLLGYGHGASGIGCALLELWIETGDNEYREAALQAFRYERAFFSAEQHNWPDLRSMTAYGVPPGQPVFAVAWCHGGPGIGFSRLRALELLDSKEVLEDLEQALALTAAACSNVVLGAGNNLCLCHGLGGNADLLIAASELAGRHALRQTAENAGHQAIAQLRPDDLPWPCGVNGAGETPNLMLGLAGIGHFFLRLYDSSRVSSILLLRQKTAVRSQGSFDKSQTLVEAVAQG